MTQLVKKFPVQAGLAAFLVYLLTFSHGLTLSSLLVTAKIAGWDWAPITAQPLLWLTTLPFRVFPAIWIPLLLNLMAAVNGALVIGLLARTLELLAWDRPLTQLGNWRHLPIIFACTLCGLEFNFWQQATALTGEMLQLLIFAASIWCLMEFRAGGNLGWLRWATVIWGAGMAENWMMLLTLPLFVAALFWLGKYRMFQARILLQFTGLGLAGFAVVVILPLANGFWPGSPTGMGEAWTLTLRQFKSVLSVVYYNFWRGHRLAVVAVVIFYLLPLLPALIRLRDEGTHNKAGVDRFQIWLYRALSLGVLLACVWLVFNPVVGPQQIIQKQTGLASPFLSLTYLLAIGSGFLAGNLVLALRSVRPSGYETPSPAENFLGRAAVPFFTALLLLAAAGLILRNIPAITLANRLPLESFAKLAVPGLAGKSGGIFSDDPQRLYVFQSVAARRENWVTVDTRSLPLPAYRRWLANRNPDIALPAPGTNFFSPADNLRWLGEFARSNQVTYLHPGFGYFYEAFYAEPQQSTYTLKKYADKSVSPPVNENTLTAQEKFWADAGPQLEAVIQNLPPQKKSRGSLAAKINERLHLQAAPRVQAQLLGEWLALAANDAGVQLQRAGHLKAAENLFAQAQALNPNNTAARINWLANSNLQNGAKMNLAAVDNIISQIGNMNNLSRFLSLNGQVDEPAFCFVLGNIFLQAGLPRQALQQFERADALAPDSIAPKLSLAEIYSRVGFAERARKCIAEIRSRSAEINKRDDLEATLALIEADTWLAQTNAANAREALQNLSGISPENPRTQSLMLRALTATGNYTNAIKLLQRQLASQPNDLGILANQAIIELKMGNPLACLKTCETALTLTNSPEFRLLQNLARTRAGFLDAAEQDYLEMQSAGQLPAAVLQGLADIALERRDTNQAVRLLEQSATNMPAGTPQFFALTNRIQQLKFPGDISTTPALQNPGK